MRALLAGNRVEQGSAEGDMDGSEEGTGGFDGPTAAGMAADAAALAGCVADVYCMCAVPPEDAAVRREVSCRQRAAGQEAQLTNTELTAEGLPLSERRLMTSSPSPPPRPSYPSCWTGGGVWGA